MKVADVCDSVYSQTYIFPQSDEVPKTFNPKL